MRLAPLALAAALAAMSLAPGAAKADELGGSLSGYLEARVYGIFGVDEALAELASTLSTLGGLALPIQGDLNEKWAVQTRLRPTATLRYGELASLKLTVEGHTSHGFFEHPMDSLGDVVALEQLVGTVTTGPIDLAFGKMVVAWGSGLLFNPTDVFNVRPPDDLNAERQGVWATRVTWGITDMMNLSIIAALDEEDCCDPTVATRYDVTVDLTDLATTVVWQDAEERLVFGFDVKSEAEVGFWAEANYSMDLTDPGAFGHIDCELGVDYTFDVLDGWYLALEWIRVGDGVDSSYIQNLVDSDTTSARPMLSGIDYLMALTRLSIGTEWTVQLLNLTNLRDPSGLVLLNVGWAATGWLELTLGGTVTYGGSDSEFGLSVPDSLDVPGLGPTPVSEELRGARMVPRGTAYLWSRFFF